MQHATLRAMLTGVPLPKPHLEGGGAEEDKTISIIQYQTSDQLPQKETTHGSNEPKSSVNNKLVTQSNLVRMPHPSPASGADAIDCAAIAQKENHHELTPAPKASTAGYEVKQQSTPTTGSIPCHKDGHYFLTLLSREKTRLLSMAEQAERDMYTLTSLANPDVSDEVFGILRAVSGKTKLLVSQKFKQFEGLCHSNLNPKAGDKFATTTEDLQGFWDMVHLQIEHVDSLFKELDLIKANNWQPTKDTTTPFVPTGTKLMKRSPVLKNGNSNGSTPLKTSPNAQLMAQKREAQRKQLLEMKRKNKIAATDKGAIASPIEIYVRESCV